MNNYRPTWIEINLNYIYENYLEAQKRVDNKLVIPVIKANAYGHGAVPIMEYLFEQNIKYFAVNSLEEALELRNINKEINILMLGPILENSLEVASINNIEITLYGEEITQAVLNANLSLTCHFKVDTGKNRYGFQDSEQIAILINELQANKNINLKGIYTHFSTSDDDEEFLRIQINEFEKVLSKIKVKPPLIHTSNSSAIFKYEKDIPFTNAVRLGISLYGLTLEKKLSIKPVMKLKTKVVQIKTLTAGSCVSYNRTYCALDEEEIIGVIPIGYGDGFMRSNKHGFVEINKKPYEIVGNITMDATMIRLDNTIKRLDEVTIFGGIISANEVAKRNNTINYEVTTLLNKRIERKFIK